MLIEEAFWLDDKDALRAIRKEVFIEEQGVSQSEEWDELDETSRHFIAYIKEEAVACIRLVEKQAEQGRAFKITRLAVKKPHRAQGIGAHLLVHASDIALSEHASSIFLHAQRDARAFYEKSGFIAQGDTFDEAGIEHVKMFFSATPEHLIRLYQKRVMRFSSPNHAGMHLRYLANCARRQISIISNDLMRDIYHNEDLYQALLSFLRDNRNARIRILVADSQNLIQESHLLTRLTQRLPSKMQIRKLLDDADTPDECYALFDRRALLLFNDESSALGFANYDNSPLCLSMLEKFDLLWQYQSEEDQNLRILSL